MPRKIEVNFIAQISTLPLSFEGELVMKETLTNTVRDLTIMLAQLPSEGMILLQEKDPLKFILSFFMLLDRGNIPLVLPIDMGDFQIEQISSHFSYPSSFINGLCKIGSLYTVPYKECYASLTSGTTGRPKICFLSIYNARLNALAHCDSLSITESDSVIQTLPLYHSYGIVAYLFSWLEKKFLLDLNQTFLGLRALNKRALHSAVINISPAQLRFMLKEKSSAPQGIKAISIGGGSIDQKSLKEFSQKLPGVKIYTTYGLTEAGPRVSTGLWRGEETGFIGEAINGVKLKVLVNGIIQDQGEGKLLVSSSMLKLNLEKDECFDKYLVTRDVVTLTEFGSIYFKTRADDLINYGGISVYPLDIEIVAKTHKDVLDAQVIKVKSEMYEEEPVLFIEPKLDIEEIRNFLKDKLTVYQMPKKIFTIERLPRTSLHKVDRKILKEMLESL